MNAVAHVKEDKMERHFAVSLMRFVFQISRKRLDGDVVFELIEFGKMRSEDFSDNITKAVLILINDFRDKNEVLPEIGTLGYERSLGKLRDSYEHKDFLKFVSRYAYKAALEESEETTSELFNDIVALIKLCKFKPYTFVELDKVASEFVKEDLRKCIRLPLSDPNTILDMTEEREFVIKVMAYIFTLNLKEVPDYFIDKLSSFSHREEDPFTQNVMNSLIMILNIQNRVKNLVGWEVIEEHYFKLALKEFSERNFFELCVCKTRKAMVDYHEKKNLQAPFKICDTLVGILRCAKEGGLFVPWQKMELTTFDILQEYNERIENEISSSHSASSSGSFVIYEQFRPLRRASKLNEVQNLEDILDQDCSCCKCS